MPELRRPRPLWPMLGALLIALTVAGCGNDGQAAGAPGQSAPATVVTTQVLSPSSWSDSLSALGTVKARESVTITAKVSETVERVHFESGDEVSAGATLVTLSGNQQQAALQAAEATAREAEQQYARGSELVQQQLIARSQLDTQRATRDAAVAQVARMRADIGDRRIRAPFAGMLGIRQVSPGALVTPGTVITTLDDVARVYVDFQLPEAELASLRQGDKVSGASIAYPGRTFEGAVTAIDPRIDPATRAVTVRADFGNDDRALRPGMLLDVHLYRPERQALVLPEIAVVQVGRESFVYRVKPDQSVEQVSVKAGTRRSGVVEIVEGVAAGDRIVIDGTGKLRPGLRIKDAAAEPAPAGEEAGG